MRLFLLLLLALGVRGADFVNDVHPILASRCLGCHAGAKAMAGLDLTDRQAALRVLGDGKASASVLIARVEGRAGRLMPPVGEKLSEKQIATLREWVDAGAPWGDVSRKESNGWTAPLEPREVPLPAGSGHPVDRFTGRPAKGLASDRVFAHRAYLDLWGLTPTPEMLERFVTDRDPDKRAKLVDRLLADERMYAGHWMSWWNDLLHNDIGVVYHGDRKAITPWLERALRTNMPYTEMVEELLNPIGAEAPEGFLIGVNWRGDVNASQMPYMQAAQNTAQVFLGINLKCASCHDSFVNKYKLKEAYGLAAMFSPQDELEVVRCDNKTGVKQGPQFLWPELGRVPAGASVSERRLAAARLFTSPRNGRLQRTIVNRYWQKLMGKGLVEPVDDMDAKPSNPDLLDWLAVEFARQGNDLKALLRLLMTSAEYQRADAMPRRISAEQLTDTLSAVTGEWRVSQSGNVDRGFLARDWQLKSSPLTRALGRPIRDQVYTTRNSEATTFQGLELENGPTLALLLSRGARRLLGELRDGPENLFDSRAFRQGEIEAKADVSGRRKVWLLLEDAGTYDPERAEVGLRQVEAVGPGGVRTIEGGRVPMKIGSRMVFDLQPGEQTFRARIWVSDASKASDINATVRVFLFGEEPDMSRLVRLMNDRPWPAPAALTSVEQAIGRLFLQVLGRPATNEEAAVARKYFPGDRLSKEGLEDLLWSLAVHPEFQYIW